MKITLKGLSLAIASAGMLTIYGCGGGGGDTAPVATLNTTIVTPSLGKFSKDTVVNLTKPDGTPLATGTIGTDGTVTLSYPATYTGPVVVTVVGATGVKYFDEGTGIDEDFGPGSTLRAVVPAPLAQVGVSALTNAAVANLEAAGGIASATPTTINDANTKIAAVFGLPDILVAPNPVSSATGKTLDLTLPADKYALVLAAFAKSAPHGTKAAALTTNLALDLKDGILDAKDGKNGNAEIQNAVTATNLATAYQNVAITLATPNSQTLAANQPLIVTTNVTTVKAVPNQSDVSLAKAMFAELRTTLNSFSNGSTGFLDTQATRMNADLNANVVPGVEKVASRISTLGMATTMFEDGKAYTSSNTRGLLLGTVPGAMLNTNATGLYRQEGSLQAVWYGYGSYTFCWTDSATGVTSQVKCAHAGADSADSANSRIKFVVYELTSPASNSYAYKATRANRAVTVTNTVNGTLFTLGTSTLVTQDSLGNPMPVGNGTLTQTVSGTTMTGLTINGTLPPSVASPTGNLATGVDTIAISAARTALTAANNFHYALSGSVSTTNLADPTKVVTLSLDSGSFIDLDETTAATTGPKPVAIKLIGTAQTTATKFTGTLDVGAFKNDADGRDYSPTSIVFNGSISDTSTGGAGEMLTGKLEAAVADYNLYQSTLPESATNYLKATVTFTGTVQAPSRPALKLVVVTTKTGISTGTVTVDYSYGSVKITGSGGTSATGNTLTLSNQAGVQVVLNSQGAGTVTKSGTTLATIGNGRINYSDSTYESLN